MDFDTLRSLAFHSEMVASRRLMQRDKVSLDDALKQILSDVAGTQGLGHLLEERRLKRTFFIENKEKKRQLSQQRYQLKQAKKTIPAATWCGWFDGSARPNPGVCAIGVLLQAPDGFQWQLSRAVGYGSSSSAEYQALIALLTLAVEQGSRDMTVYGDSRVVIDDIISPEISCAQSLASFRLKALELMEKIPGVRLQWIPRTRNQQADALADVGFESL